MSCNGKWTLALKQNQAGPPKVYEDEIEFAIDLFQDTWPYKGTAGRLNLGGNIVKTSQVASGDFCQTGILFNRPPEGVVNPASWFWDVWDFEHMGLGCLEDDRPTADTADSMDREPIDYRETR